MIRKTLNKLRIWLIYKLGGSYPKHYVDIKRTDSKIVPISCRVSIPNDMILSFSKNPVGSELFIRRELSYKLAGCLMENDNLYEIFESEDYNTSSKVYKAEMMVCECKKGGVQE